MALKIPQKYEDTRLETPLLDGAFCAIFCEVLSKVQTPKTVVFDLRLLSHNEESIKAVFFSPKPYQKNLLNVGERLFLYGKISRFPYLSIVHPKKLARAGEIRKIYAKGAQNASFNSLASKYLTLQNLQAHGLDDETAKGLLSLHFPATLNDIYAKNGEMRPSAQSALKTAEAFAYLLGLSSKNIRFAAKKVSPQPIEPFLKKLPFKPTNDQLNAINECLADITKEMQAKRVVIGDVGCGKTVVILALAHMTGAAKTALLAPTAILANQIYAEALKYLTLNVILVTQSSKAKEEEIQKADFIVGTHALLYKNLPPCQTLIVDEQHRFGANQRALIAKLVSNEGLRPHYFQFTATPIPRTQALIESTIADATFIREIPVKKRIETKVISKEGFAPLLEHIKCEIERGFQAAIIYPLVEKSEESEYMSLEEAEGFWKSRFEKVFVTHGKDSAKEDVFLEFKDGGELILTTTVMEVGISLPRLSTIVVVGAEKLGLAALHQLRGRVARNSDKGWCFLFTKRQNSERLQKFAKTTNGFEIAELDLEYRDFGDLISGERQSGKGFRAFDPKTDEKELLKAKGLLSGLLAANCGNWKSYG